MMVEQDPTKFADLLRIQTAIATLVVLDDPPGDYALIGAVCLLYTSDAADE